MAEHLVEQTESVLITGLDQIVWAMHSHFLPINFLFCHGAQQTLIFFKDGLNIALHASLFMK